MLTLEQTHVLTAIERQSSVVTTDVPGLDRDAAQRVIDQLVQRKLVDVRRDTYGPVYFLTPEGKAI